MSKLNFPTYSIIPFEVLSNQNLSDKAKLLYGVIAGLAVNEGYCWATNEQIAELYEVEERTIRRRLEELEVEGLIFREHSSRSYRDKNEKFLWKHERKIWVGAKIKKRFEADKNVPLVEADKNVPLVEADKNVRIRNNSLKDKSIKEERGSSSLPLKDLFEANKARFDNADFQSLDLNKQDREQLVKRGLELNDDEWRDVCKAFTQRAATQVIDPIVPYFTSLINCKAKPNETAEQMKERRRVHITELTEKIKTVCGEIAQKLCESTDFSRTENTVGFRYYLKEKSHYDQMGYFDERLVKAFGTFIKHKKGNIEDFKRELEQLSKLQELKNLA